MLELLKKNNEILFKYKDYDVKIWENELDLSGRLKNLEEGSQYTMTLFGENNPTFFQIVLIKKRDYLDAYIKSILSKQMGSSIGRIFFKKGCLTI